MSLARSNLVSDGFTSLESGVDAGRPPNAIGINQVAYAVNASLRGGFIESRPGFKPFTLDFNGDAALQTAFEGGWFQGAAYYDPGGICCMINGKFYYIQIDTGKVQDLTPDDGGPTDCTKAWFQQAENYMIIQDGSTRAIIFDGGGARRSSAEANEVPTGTAMAYSNGRLWVAKTDRKTLVAGDIVYGPSGTSEHGRRDAVLKFTENDFLNEGGEFSAYGGNIRALKPIGVVDTPRS